MIGILDYANGNNYLNQNKKSSFRIGNFMQYLILNPILTLYSKINNIPTGIQKIDNK